MIRTLVITRINPSIFKGKLPRVETETLLIDSLGLYPNPLDLSVTKDGLPYKMDIVDAKEVTLMIWNCQKVNRVKTTYDSMIVVTTYTFID